MNILKKMVLTLGVALAVVVATIAVLTFWPRVCSAQETKRPVPTDQWNDSAKLWLSRSLIGEVGWRRPEEQVAVAWVYATRAKRSHRYTFTQLVRRYSAAIRTPGKRRNPWLFELGLTNKRPTSWPDGPRWKGLHEVAWMEVLALVDNWAEGRIPNPCPRANHFGGYVDRHRAEAMRWTRVKCSVKTRNRFYNSLKLVPRGRGRS